MKLVLLLSAIFLSGLFPAAAQDRPAPADLPRMSPELKEVLDAGVALISAAVDIRPDGSARTTHEIGSFSTRIEFRDLMVREVVKLPLDEAEKEQGVTRRYEARLGCTAHRIWDGPMATWSAWRRDHYGFFPTTIVIEEIGGKLQARARRIDDFSPGIDGAMTASTR